MTPANSVILASGSAIRARILSSAGVNFTVVKPDVDEAAIKRGAAAKGLDLDKTALMLAEAKTMKVADRNDDLVIGSDQIMEFEGRAYDKPVDMAEAKARLLKLQGAEHRLINAVCIARDRKIIWRRVSRPRLTMRKTNAKEIDAYLEEAGPEILSSVGAYQIENLGARLFEKIEGDYFEVLGLALFPLLEVLRREGALEY